jgi:hypothetical protein
MNSDYDGSGRRSVALFVGSAPSNLTHRYLFSDMLDFVLSVVLHPPSGRVEGEERAFGEG